MIKKMLMLILSCVCTSLYAYTGDDLFGDIARIFKHHSKKEITSVYNKIIDERILFQHTFVPTFEIVRQSLQDDEIAIESFSFPEDNGRIKYIAFSVRSNYDAPHVCELFNEDELNPLLETGEAMFKNTIVSSLLLEPLREELIGVKKIFFTPSGKLHLFAIEYCNVESGAMLAENYQFYRLTSSGIIAHKRNKLKHFNNYAIWGGIDYDTPPIFEEKYVRKSTRCQMGYLQDSYLAALDIYQSFKEKGLKGIMYANEQATEQSFKEIPNQGIQLLLIETHGVNNPNDVVTKYPTALMLAGSSYVMDGGIVPCGYEDGLLFYEEIASLDLSTIDLAVISACKSALGDIDWKGVNGLMRGFKTAGVNSLVMTTDDVVDYVSGEVWKSFFHNITEGMSKRASLLEAIKHIKTIHEGFYQSPKFWTPFVLVDGID